MAIVVVVVVAVAVAVVVTIVIPPVPPGRALPPIFDGNSTSNSTIDIFPTNHLEMLQSMDITLLSSLTHIIKSAFNIGQMDKKITLSSLFLRLFELIFTLFYNSLLKITPPNQIMLQKN